MIFGILGLIIPICAFIALAIGKKGKPGFILGLIGTILFMVYIVILVAR